MLITLLIIVSCMFSNVIASSENGIRPFRRRRGRILNDSHRWRRRLEQQQQEEEETTVSCEAIGKCEMCTDEERALEGGACEETGRQRQYKCTTIKGGTCFHVSLLKLCWPKETP